MEELDEFGIPISTKEVKADEFGIPMPEKDEETDEFGIPVSTSDLNTNNKYSPENILSDEIKLERDKMIEAGVSYGKIETSEEDLNKYKEELSKVIESKNKKDASSSNLQVRIDRKLLTKKANELELKIAKAERDNKDLISWKDDKKYFINGEEKSNSEFFKEITSNKVVDELRKNEESKIDISVVNDPEMSSILQNQIDAAKDGFWSRAGKDAAFTAKSFWDMGMVKSAELLTTFMPTDLVAGMMYFSPMTSYEGGYLDLYDSENNKNLTEEEIEDKYLLGLHNGIVEKNKELRGAQMIRTEDVINRFSDGDIVGGIEEITEISIGSSPYLAATLINPYIGSAVMYNTAQTSKYYELLDEGVSKDKALVASNLSGLIEVGDVLVTRGLFNNSMNTAKKVVSRTTSELSKEEVSSITKSLIKNFTIEPGTEFIQGTAGELTSQWAKGSFDFDKATRSGAIEAMAALPTSAVISSPTLGSYVFNSATELRKSKALENSIYTSVMNLGSVESKEERIALKNHAKRSTQELVEINKKNKELANNLDKDTSDELIGMTSKELELMKLLDSHIPSESRETISKELEELSKLKESLLKEKRKELKSKVDDTKKESKPKSKVSENKKRKLRINKELSKSISKIKSILNEETSNDMFASDVVMSDDNSGINVNSKLNTKERIARVIDTVESISNNSQFYNSLSLSEKNNFHSKILNEFGIKVKSSPSIRKLFKKDKDKRLLFSTKDLIKLEFESIKNHTKSNKEARDSIKSKINSISSKGDISAKKAISITSKLSNVDVFNEDSVSDFFNYLEKEISASDNKYLNRERLKSSKLKKRAKSLLSKLDLNKNTRSDIDYVLDADTKSLSIELTELHNDILSNISSLGKVSSNNYSEINGKVKEFTKRNKEEINNSNELVNKVYDKFNSELTYEENVGNIRDEFDLTESELSQLSKDRKIYEQVSLKTNKTKKSDLDLYNELNESRSGIKEIKSDNKLISRLKDLILSITNDEYNSLSKKDKLAINKSVKLLLDTKSNSTELIRMLDKIDAKRSKDNIPLSEITDSGFIGTLSSKVKTGILNAFKNRANKKHYQRDKLRLAPLANIDQIFKVVENSSSKFKSTQIYQTLFRPAAIAYSNIDSEINKSKRMIAKANSLLSLNQNERVKQKAKISYYQMQREYELNEGNSEVNSAKDWIEATINDSENEYDTKTKKVFSSLLNEISKMNDNSLSGIYNSFTSKEKKSISIIDKLYEDNKGKAEADALYQGKIFNSRDGYIHLPENKKDRTKIIETLDELSKSSDTRNPSVKSKALTKRTGKAHSVSLDPMVNASASATKTINSFYMNPIIYKSNIMFSELKKDATNKFESNLIESLEDIHSHTMKNIYEKSNSNGIEIQNIAKKISKAGYRVALAGGVRSSWELISNGIHAAFTIGGVNLKNGFKILSNHSDYINDSIKNLPTTQKERLSGGTQLSSKDIESNLIQQVDMFNSELTTNELKAKAKIATSFLSEGKGLGKLVQFNDWLISAPDRVISRSIFTSKVASEFKKITGSDLNWKELASNNNYYSENREALNEATKTADTSVLDSVASNNPFEGINKNITEKNANGWKTAIKFIDSYMTRFRVFEYYSTLKGVQGLIGKGEISRKEGIMLLSGTIARMSMYKIGIDFTMNAIYSILGIEDDEIEDMDDQITRSVSSSLITLTLGRSVGNLSLLLPNHLIETANEIYGEKIGLRDGKYDKFENSLVFDKVPNVDDRDKTYRTIVGMSGSFAPAIKATDIAYSSITDYIVESYKDEYIDEEGNYYKNSELKSNKEKEEEAFDELFFRTPLVIAGATGYIPSYKTFKKIANQEKYKNK